jgi:multiple sugar transport system ATP-binding protein
MAQVTIRSARKSYGNVEVIHGVDLDVGDGEFVVLVGPSGCGKSTLLRMIAGLETVTGGTISIGDRVVNNLPPKERDIAMVFQSYALYPHMKVADNMAFALKLRRTDPKIVRERVKTAADILGLTPYLDRYPRQLSGGQRQRVAMGRAIVRDPQVFLFDEPLSNLDAKLRVQMRTEIKELHQRLKTTTVFVTHDQVEAMTMADRIVVMNEGVVEQIGTPLELYDRPGNLFVATFIGSPGMNLIKGTAKANGSLNIEAGGSKLPLVGAHKVQDGQPVVYGIRPEHIDLTGDAGVPAARRERDRRGVPRAAPVPAGPDGAFEAASGARSSVRRRFGRARIARGTAREGALRADLRYGSEVFRPEHENEIAGYCRGRCRVPCSRCCHGSGRHRGRAGLQAMHRLSQRRRECGESHGPAPQWHRRSAGRDAGGLQLFARHDRGGTGGARLDARDARAVHPQAARIPSRHQNELRRRFGRQGHRRHHCLHDDVLSRLRAGRAGIGGDPGIAERRH